MKLTLLTIATVLAMTATTGAEDPKTPMLFEMRIYYAAPGKFDALNARFRDHTAKLFTDHGMRTLGYFVPVGDNKEGKLVYFLAYPSKDAREKSWKEFSADPKWQAAFKESEKDGKLVDRVEQVFMNATDYTPPPGIWIARQPRVFELRTYTATKGNLPALDARFRDHTIRLFEKHGITNMIYWHKTPDQKGADVSLIYLLAHNSQDSAKAGFDAFRKDPAWISAREESEKKAGGSLTEEKGGVLSEFLKPTDYSPVK